MLVLLMMEDMLNDLGCESVATAATVDQALALIEAQSFDLALLDMNLNGNQTYSVADALAAHEVPFAFSTGYSGHGIREGYRERPMLKKPFMEWHLSAVLTRLIAP